MANHKTGAQRYNDRMDKIFDRAKSEGRGLVGNSGLKGYGVNSPAMMDARNKAIHAKMKGKKTGKFETAAMREKAERLKVAMSDPNFGKTQPF